MNLTCHISPITHLNGTTTWTANWTFREELHQSIILTGFPSADAAKNAMQSITTALNFHPHPTSYVIHPA